MTQDTCGVYCEVESELLILLSTHIVLGFICLHQIPIRYRSADSAIHHDKVQLTSRCGLVNQIIPLDKHAALPDQNIFTGGFCAMPMCWGTMDEPWQQSGPAPVEA